MNRGAGSPDEAGSTPIEPHRGVASSSEALPQPASAVFFFFKRAAGRDSAARPRGHTAQLPHHPVPHSFGFARGRRRVGAWGVEGAPWSAPAWVRCGGCGGAKVRWPPWTLTTFRPRWPRAPRARTSATTAGQQRPHDGVGAAAAQVKKSHPHLGRGLPSSTWGRLALSRPRRRRTRHPSIFPCDFLLLKPPALKLFVSYSDDGRPGEPAGPLFQL